MADLEKCEKLQECSTQSHTFIYTCSWNWQMHIDSLDVGIYMYVFVFLCMCFWLSLLEN